MKKVLALLLIMTLIMSVGLSAMAFEDTIGLSCEEDVNLLYDLGIVDGKSNQMYAPADSLTRAEMVTYALRMMGLDGQGGGRPLFTDVTEEHWAYGNITAAYDMGLVSGVDATSFMPDTPVTFTQAVKILTVMLGYNLQAEAAGGYPSGYLIMAQHIGLLEGVSKDEAISRGTMASLAANALDIHPSEQVGFGADSGMVSINESETLLSFYLKVDTYEGRVTANSTDVVADGAQAKKGEIAVGDLIFAVGKTNAENFIGQNVIIRAKEVDGKLTVLHIASDGDSVFSVAGKDILPRTTVNTLVLEGENGKDKKISISGDATLVYNGIPKAWTQTDLLSDRSAYTFITNRAGEIHTIFQNHYENHVVKSVSHEMKKVYFKDGTNIVLSETEWKKYNVTNADGSAVSIENIFEWDVISVCQNGTEILKAVVSDTRLEGVVTEESQDEVLIDGKAYTVAKSLSESEDKKPTIGEKAIFSLDAYGEIAAVNTNTLYENYAFLVRGETTSGLNKETRLKMFLLSGEMKVFDVADKVKLNGMTKDSDVLLSEEVLKNGEKIARQLVTYELNQDGKLIELRTAVDGSGMDWQERQSVFSRDFEISASDRYSTGNYIGYTMSSLASRYKLTDKTKIICIPESDNAEDKEYGIQEFRNVIHGDDFANSVLYDVDKDNVISIIVQKKSFSNAASYNSENIAIVSHVSDFLDREGNLVRAVRVVLPNGTEKALEIAENATLEIPTSAITNIMRDPYVNARNLSFSALSKGDVIQYETNGLGCITSAAVRLRYNYRYNIEKSLSQYGEMAPEPNYNYNGMQYLYARVDRTVDDGVIVYAPATADGPEYERLFSAINGRTVLYNSTRGTITGMDYKDIEEGDNVFILRILTDMKIVVVYR